MKEKNQTKKKTKKKNLRETGGSYEKAAGAYLTGCGYRILQYNFRCRYAEIDIIALDGETLVFCEVKYRTGADTCYALEAVDAHKQRRISQAALFYLARHGGTDRACRFDVVGITDRDITLVRHAFDYTGV